MSLIDQFAIISFVILTLYVGIRHGKKVKDIKDYALGGRNFSTAALVATMSATWASGSGFFVTIQNTYANGLYFLLALLCMGVQLLLTGVILVPKMKEFLGDVSVAESMGKMYGTEVRIITACCSFIGLVGAVAVQFKALGEMAGYFTNYSKEFMIISLGGVVIIYSVLGGIRSVTITDILQFFAFGLALPLLGLIIWNKFCNTGINISEIKLDDKFNLIKVLNPTKDGFWSMLPLMLYFMIPAMIPSAYQRILVSRNLDQAKQVCIISAFVMILVILSTAWLPFLVYNIDSKLDPAIVPSYIINNFSYIGLKALLIIAVLSMAMSSADSNLNTSSVLFAHDVCKPFNLIPKKTLLVSRMFASFLGITAIILALSAKNLLSILLFVNSFYMPVVSVPLVLSILGFRSTRYSVLISMFAGTATVLYIRFYSTPFDPIITGMAVNLLTLFAVHYLFDQDGGWVEDETRPSVFKDMKKSLERFRENCSNMSVERVINSFDQFSPKSTSSYTGLGVYYIILTITTMYSTQSIFSENSSLLVIYQIMLVTGLLLIMKPIWPQSIGEEIKEIFAKFFWHLSIFYMLIIFSAMFVVLSEFSRMQFITFTMNIILVIILSGWRNSVFMTIIGFYLGLSLFTKITGSRDVSLLNIGSTAFILVYSLLLIGSVLVIFLKPKEQYLEITEGNLSDSELKARKLTYDVSTRNQKIDYLKKKVANLEFHAELRKEEVSKAIKLKDQFINNLEHEGRTPITGINSLSEILYDYYDQIEHDKRREIVKSIAQSTARLNSYVSNLVEFSRLQSANYPLHCERIDVVRLARNRLNICKKLYIKTEDLGKQKFAINLHKNIYGFFDRYYLTHLIDNLIINAIKYCPDGKITLRVAATADRKLIDLSVTDEGIGIPDEDKHDIFGVFMTSSLTRSQAEGRGVGLALSKKIVEIFKGTITVEDNGEKGSIFRVLLPRYMDY